MLTSTLRPLFVSPRARIAAVIAVVIFLLDQMSKFWAVKHLTSAFSGVSGLRNEVGVFLSAHHPSRASRVIVSENFWSFVYAENPGAAWSFLHDAPEYFRTPFFLCVSLAAMVFILVYYRRTTPEQRLLRLALALVFGGALGNFFDRVRLRYVIDFIDWHWYARYTWPTFNVADAAITVGVVMMAADMLFHKPRERSAVGSSPRPISR
ncbi:MAG: signal peptidase II [Clostridia bacterium]|nr:signal peptidase II [Deltaproteobacteria bacterium]